MGNTIATNRGLVASGWASLSAALSGRPPTGSTTFIFIGAGWTRDERVFPGHAATASQMSVVYSDTLAGAMSDENLALIEASQLLIVVIMERDADQTQLSEETSTLMRHAVQVLMKEPRVIAPILLSERAFSIATCHASGSCRFWIDFTMNAIAEEIRRVEGPVIDGDIGYFIATFPLISSLFPATRHTTAMAAQLSLP